jgi:hypothetical protein
MFERAKRIDLWAALCAGFLGGMAGARLTNAPSVEAQRGRAKVVEAEEFRLVQPDGKAVGRFQVDSNGRPNLALFDAHGEVRAVLGVLASGSPHLALSDRQGQVRAALAVWTDERVSLILSDGTGTPRAQVAVPSDGSPSVELSDRAGKLRAVVGAVPMDLATNPRLRQESSLALFDGEGKAAWSAP